MRSMHLSLAASLVLTSGGLAACGGDSDDGRAGAPAATVTIENSRYEPDELVVPAGAEVVFTNLDQARHTVTSAGDSTAEFDSGEMVLDEEFRTTFAEPGTYEYFCEIHPTMLGAVVVE